MATMWVAATKLCHNEPLSGILTQPLLTNGRVERAKDQQQTASYIVKSNVNDPLKITASKQLHLHVWVATCNPPSLFYYLVASWPPAAQVWSPVKN